MKVVCQDELLDKNCIEQEVRTLDLNPEAAFCWSRRRVINQSGKTMSSFRVSPSSWTSKLRGTHANEMADFLHSLRGRVDGVTSFDVTLGVLRAKIREKMRILVIVLSSARK